MGEIDKKSRQPSTPSKTVFGVIVIILLCALVMFVVLALLGPAIGGVFSNVISGLNGDGTPEIEVEATEPFTNTPTRTTLPPTPTQRPTSTITREPPGVATSDEDSTIEAAGLRETETAEAVEAGDSPTDTSEPTEAALPTSMPQPTIIADARLQIRDRVSGEIFGDGRISLYAPDVVSPGQSVRVELELNLANLYITPTPAGAITAFPVPTRITATPPTHNSLGTPLPSPSPRFPIHEESGVQFYQRMGASLFCPPNSFVGCSSERTLSQAKIVTTTTTRFSWLLTQQTGAIGVQNLSVELWAVFNNLDGELEYVTQWEHPFSIEIVTETGSSSRLWGVLLVAAVMLTGVVGVVVYRAARPQQAKAFGVNKNKPKVFISYRRQPSWSLARSVATSLERRGADVFLDVDDINEGRFSEILQKAIEDADYFVPILTPETLESKWVRREIELAIKLKKTIVPLTTEGFNFYAADLPEDLQELSSHNAITVTPEFFEEAINRLATRFLKLGN